MRRSSAAHWGASNSQNAGVTAIQAPFTAESCFFGEFQSARAQQSATAPLHASATLGLLLGRVIGLAIGLPVG